MIGGFRSDFGNVSVDVLFSKVACKVGGKRKQVITGTACFLHYKSNEVCMIARPLPASLPHKGQVTEQTTVKRYDLTFETNNKKWISYGLVSHYIK